ncbi:MAG: GlsB/YeaQ/YmgE family stress response membrane protein [Thermoleophilia bacterium]|nr:GlsB/YeaQ/YmgE family stress response membrane protein [Thermoleophilia bacterium]
MGIIAFLLLGVIAGAIAKAVMPGSDGGGIFMTMVLGVIGAVVGGFAAAALFNAHPLDGFFELSSWACAIVGSIIVLAVYRMAFGSRDRSRI